MKDIKTKRKFSGKIYTLYSTYHTKSRINPMAKRFRDGGDPARIVNTPKDYPYGKYALYVKR